MYASEVLLCSRAVGRENYSCKICILQFTKFLYCENLELCGICNMYKTVHASNLVNQVYKKNLTFLPGTACMYIVGTVGLTYPN